MQLGLYFRSEHLVMPQSLRHRGDTDEARTLAQFLPYFDPQPPPPYEYVLRAERELAVPDAADQATVIATLALSSSLTACPTVHPANARWIPFWEQVSLGVCDGAC